MREKVWASLDDQVGLLVERGLPDAPDFRDDLAAFGYYRLGGYAYPLRQRAPEGSDRSRLNEFVPGARMRHVVDLYHFDERLRQAAWRAVSRLEVACAPTLDTSLGSLIPTCT